MAEARAEVVGLKTVVRPPRPRDPPAPRRGATAATAVETASPVAAAAAGAVEERGQGWEAGAAAPAASGVASGPRLRSTRRSILAAPAACTSTSWWRLHRTSRRTRARGSPSSSPGRGPNRGRSTPCQASEAGPSRGGASRASQSPHCRRCELQARRWAYGHPRRHRSDTTRPRPAKGLRTSAAATARRKCTRTAGRSRSHCATHH